jgi:hypothetical protein
MPNPTQDIEFKGGAALFDPDSIERAAEIGCGIGEGTVEVEENHVPGVGRASQTRTARTRKLTSVLRPSVYARVTGL